MPSQEQVRWAQLRVGLTVLFSSLTLAVLIFLMTGTTGLFTKKFLLYSYVDNAGGLRNGAPVRLQGVDIGNVTEIRVVPGVPGHERTPVRITMKIGAKNGVRSFVKEDSVVLLSTAGVLGETFVDIDSTFAKGAPARDGGELKAQEVPDIQDVVRSSQSTLKNVDSLLQRADRIMTFVESGQGSIGRLIYDKQLYDNMNRSVAQMNGILTDLNSGKGSVGKLLKDEELYNKLNASVDKLNNTMDAIDRGDGTVGKLIHDPALYNNANQTITKANQLMDSINSGQGTLGKLAKDPEMARKLEDTITRLNTITTGLANGEGTAGKFLKDPSMYNNTDQLLVESRALIKAVRENPKKYLTIHLKLF